jgi:hypothetical protein
MYVNDFDRNGKVEHIITMFNGDDEYPMIQQKDIVKQIPSLKAKYPTFNSYREQKMSDIFNEETLNSSIIQEVYNLKTSILINEGGSEFSLKSLPSEAQFSPTFGISVHDFNRDGKPDILIGGNFYRSKPEAGIYDASYGCLLIGDGKGNFDFIPNRISGLSTKGEIRDFELIEDKNILIVLKNNDFAEVFKYVK